MRGPTLWIAAALGSVLAHLAAFAFLDLSVTPDPLTQQPRPETRMTLDAYQVDQQDAAAQSVTSETAPEQSSKGTALNSGAIPETHAKALPTGTQSLVPIAPTAAQTIAPSPPPAATLPSSPPTSARLDPSTPPIAPIAAEPLPQATLAATPPPTLTAAALQAPATPAPPQPPNAQSAPSQTLPSEHATAALAWNFGERTVTDPTSLAVIQAFMAPADLATSASNAGQVRDGLAAILTGVDCARLTATFIPETGALELRGHVPDPALRAPILQALQAQIGDGIPVTDNLLHLPRPQCGALTDIADAGLPQSTDQLTNALLIGENAQAREYGFSEGQRLAFDLSAPDYEAVVYVDYFDAAGQVIHLIPNETVPLVAHPAKTSFGVGTDSAGQSGLDITIGPPFGQEIAVAFAASAPLFADLRPLVEPADAYLAELKARVADARAANPDFKGEWVYFFITTTPATQ
ncbi:MAG: hypothetical protein WBN04_19560 [Paracoccaceae bacterium]